MTTTFSPKDPAEQFFYGVDFAALLGTGETITSATPSLRPLVAEDATVNAMLIGHAVINGSTVTHKIGGGQAGNRYRFGITIVTSAGQTFVQAGDIEIRAAL